MGKEVTVIIGVIKKTNCYYLLELNSFTHCLVEKKEIFSQPLLSLNIIIDCEKLCDICSEQKQVCLY